MILAAFLALAATQTAEDAAGRYEAAGERTACALTLRPAAAQLPESNITGEAASGFAFAMPGCPGGLSDVALWRLSLADGVLTLVDAAGEPVFSGRLRDRVWAGETSAGDAVTLRPR
jgi:hypothetical protein